MKKLALVMALVLSAGSASAEPVLGTWRTQPGDSGGYLDVAIAPCGDRICGTILQAYDASDAPITDYAHLGKPILWDMVANGDGTYDGGRIWAPDRDKDYKSTMALSGNSLTVKGCAGICTALTSRSQTWARLN